MIDNPILNTIFNSSKRLEEQLFSQCDPMEKTIEDNHYSGYIEQKLSNGLIAKSEWYEGKRNGCTVIYDADGIILIKMMFKNGSLHGIINFYSKTRTISISYDSDNPTGFVRIKDGPYIVFEGTFYNGKVFGKCVYRNEYDYIYEGNMVNGFAKGYGVLKNEDGTILAKGEWLNGLYEKYKVVFDTEIKFIRPTPKQSVIPLIKESVIQTGKNTPAHKESVSFSDLIYSSALLSLYKNVSCFGSTYTKLIERYSERIVNVSSIIEENNVIVNEILSKQDDIKKQFYDQQKVLPVSSLLLSSSSPIFNIFCNTFC